MVMTSSQGTMSAARFRSRWRRTPRSFRIGAVILFCILSSPPPVPFGLNTARRRLEPAPLSGAELGASVGVDQLGRDVFSRAVHAATS
jgi:ABC-type dipeptide/oligopeptide/nickel transport system permease subunit